MSGVMPRTRDDEIIAKYWKKIKVINKDTPHKIKFYTRHGYFWWENLKVAFQDRFTNDRIHKVNSALEKELKKKKTLYPSSF